MRTLLAPAALLFAAACASAPATTDGPAPMTTTTTTTAATGAMNPVGSYSFTTNVNGETVSGSVQIMGAPGAYTGSISSNALPNLPISSVTVNGQRLTINAGTPNGPVVMIFNFTGNDFTGNWNLGGETGAVTGRRTQ